jgi:putative SOS response-associated peptidase YedK
MCGRYSLATPTPAQLRARFPIGESVETRQRYNVAPGDDILTVTTDRDGAPRGEVLRWGFLPFWAKTPSEGFKMINARAETIADKPAYRSSFERYRCLIIADGFYEWQPREHAATQPFHITRVDRQPFAFAGLWSVWHRGDPDELRTCTIVTTAADDLIAPIHDRKPVILIPEVEALWLDPGTPEPVLHDLLAGLPPAEIALRPVGTAVNDAHYDGPECLADPPPEPQATLFG